MRLLLLIDTYVTSGFANPRQGFVWQWIYRKHYEKIVLQLLCLDPVCIRRVVKETRKGRTQILFRYTYSHIRIESLSLPGSLQFGRVFSSFYLLFKLSRPADVSLVSRGSTFSFQTQRTPSKCRHFTQRSLNWPSSKFIVVTWYLKS